MNIRPMEQQCGGEVFVAFTMALAPATGIPYDKSFNSAAVSRLKIVQIRISAIIAQLIDGWFASVIGTVGRSSIL